MRSPGHQQHPQHLVLERHVTGRLRARLGADVLAESSDVIEVDEDGNPPRFYFPRPDVRMDALHRTDVPTHCPFKGDGVLYAMAVGDGEMPDAAWSYEATYDEHADLKDRIAFWSEKFDGLQFEAVPS